MGVTYLEDLFLRQFLDVVELVLPVFLPLELLLQLLLHDLPDGLVRVDPGDGQVGPEDLISDVLCQLPLQFRTIRSDGDLNFRPEISY